MKEILIGLLLIASTSVLAGGRGDPHHDDTGGATTTNIETTIYNTKFVESAGGMAGGGHHFDYGTYAIQQSVTLAVLKDSKAVSAAMANRDCKDCGLWSGTIVYSETDIDTEIVRSVGAILGYTWSY